MLISPTILTYNQLIASGATVYLHPKQLIEIEEIQSDSLPGLKGDEKKIENCLTNSKKTIEDIERETGINQLELLELLLVMELEGRIQALPGGRFQVGVRPPHNGKQF